MCPSLTASLALCSVLIATAANAVDRDLEVFKSDVNRKDSLRTFRRLDNKGKWWKEGGLRTKSGSACLSVSLSGFADRAILSSRLSPLSPAYLPHDGSRNNLCLSDLSERLRRLRRDRDRPK